MKHPERSCCKCGIDEAHYVGDNLKWRKNVLESGTW